MAFIHQDPQWLAARRESLGASDAPVVCGLSPWRTPYELYLEKHGRLPTQPMSAPMEWGLRLEPAIAQAYMDKEGRIIEKCQDPMRHPEIEWMTATPDYLCQHEPRIIELKTASPYYADEWGEEGTDHVPDMYLVQVHHQMMVTGIRLTDIAVLIGGSDFRVYHVQFNQNVADMVGELERQFWAMVQARTPPEPDFESKSTIELLKCLHPVESGLVVDLGAEALEIVENWEGMKAEAKDCSSAAEFLKARLLHAMGPASIGQLPDGRQLVRKQITRKPYSVPEVTYPEIRVKEPNKPKRKATV